MSKILLLGVTFISTVKLDIFECKLIPFTRQTSSNGLVLGPSVFFITTKSLIFKFLEITESWSVSLLKSLLFYIYLCTAVRDLYIHADACNLPTYHHFTLRRYCPRPPIKRHRHYLQVLRCCMPWGWSDLYSSGNVDVGAEATTIGDAVAKYNLWSGNEKRGWASLIGP